MHIVLYSAARGTVIVTLILTSGLNLIMTVAHGTLCGLRSAHAEAVRERLYTNIASTLPPNELVVYYTNI